MTAPLIPANEGDVEKLLPCPFCGGDAFHGETRYSPAVVNSTWDDGTPITEGIFVNCAACGAKAGGAVVGGLRTPAHAARAWNRRASPPPVEAEMVPDLFWVDDDPEYGHIECSDAIEAAGGYTARGNVVAIREGKTLGVKHWATLPAADDSHSDDWWEFAASTHEEADAALKAEIARRVMLSAAPKDMEKGR